MEEMIDTLKMLRPQGGWVLYGDDFDSILWDEKVTPLTRAEFDLGLIEIEKWKIEKAKLALEARAAAEAKLSVLGLTTDDLKALGF